MRVPPPHARRAVDRFTPAPPKGAGAPKQSPWNSAPGDPAAPVGPGGVEIDTHEYLKNEIFASGTAASDNHFEKQRPSPDEVYGGSNQYVILDSWVKDQARSAPARGQFSWNFMVQGVSQDQTVGVKDVIDTVTEIQIGAFMIPNFFPAQQMDNSAGQYPGFPRLVPRAAADPIPTDALSATFGFFPYIGRITIEMVEIGLQSISQGGAAVGLRYHFEADVVPVFATQGTVSTALGGNTGGNPTPIALRVVPLPGFDTYVFTDPIRDVHGLTVVFHSVDRNLPFPPDVLSGGTAYTNSAVYPFLAFSFPVAQKDFGAVLRYLRSALDFPNGGVNTQLMFSGMATGNAPIDAWVNQAPGLVGSIPQISAPGVALASLETAGFGGDQTRIQFVVAPLVDVTPLVPAAPLPGVDVEIPSADTITVRFATARVRIPLRLKRVVPRLTNYQ